MYRFPAAIILPISWTQVWGFHTELYKNEWNILADNLSTESRTDLRLSKVDKLFICHKISNSWLFLLKSFDFMFSLHDSKNQQY